MKRIATVLALALAFVFTSAGLASAHTHSVDSTCEQVVVTLDRYAASSDAVDPVDQWWSWTGGPSQSHPFPGDNWQADNGNHNGLNGPDNQAFKVGHGVNSSWFYHQVSDGRDARANHVTVWVNGEVVDDVDFSTSFSKTYHFPNVYVGNNYRVKVTAWDSDKWSFDTGTVDVPACDLPPQPEPQTKDVVRWQKDCDTGLFKRTGTQETPYVWSGTEWVLGDPGPVVWTSDWTYVRDLTGAEKHALACEKPLRPQPVIEPVHREYTDCDGHWAQDGSQTTTFVWDRKTWSWLPVMGEPEWQVAIWQRDLTGEEWTSLECQPPPKPEPVTERKSRDDVRCDGTYTQTGTQVFDWHWNVVNHTWVQDDMGPVTWSDGWVKSSDETNGKSCNGVVPEPVTPSTPNRQGPAPEVAPVADTESLAYTGSNNVGPLLTLGAILLGLGITVFVGGVAWAKRQ